MTLNGWGVGRTSGDVAETKPWGGSRGLLGQGRVLNEGCVLQRAAFFWLEDFCTLPAEGQEVASPLLLAPALPVPCSSPGGLPQGGTPAAPASTPLRR